MADIHYLMFLHTNIFTLLRTILFLIFPVMKKDVACTTNSYKDVSWPWYVYVVEEWWW